MSCPAATGERVVLAQRESNMDKEQVIIGCPPSKSNSYRVIKIAGHGSLGKTAAMKKYEQGFYMQCGRYRDKMITGYFNLDIDVYFPTMSHDLDNSLKVVLDCLQGCKAIKNDNRCVAINARKFIDKNNPRIEFTLTEVEL